MLLESGAAGGCLHRCTYVVIAPGGRGVVRTNLKITKKHHDLHNRDDFNLVIISTRMSGRWGKREAPYKACTLWRWNVEGLSSLAPLSCVAVHMDQEVVGPSGD